jgi:alpha-1,2-mannosyltransferase
VQTDSTARSAPAIWRWALLALFVAGIAAAHHWYGNRHQFYDLDIYRQAVHWWLDGHDLYKFTKPDAVQGVLGFTYPPFGGVVLVPFAVLPRALAVGVYTVVTAAALIVTTWWLLAPVARRHRWFLPFVMILALTVISTLEPIRETYTFGQINLLLVFAILLDLLILVPRQSRWAGVAIGLAAAVKLTPAIFIVYLLLSRRRRAALVAMATAAGATLLTAAIAPRASWAFWTDTLWGGGGLGNAAYTFNQSIYALLARFSDPAKPNGVLWAALVLVAAALGLWRARRAALAGDEVTGLTIAGFAGGLVSPITWAHHLYWFVPALVVLVDAAFSPEVRAGLRRAYGTFAAVIVVTVGLGAVSWFEQGLPRDPWDKGVQGFLIENWYLLLTVALMATLPIRSWLPATQPWLQSTSASRRPDGEAAAVR